MITGQPVPMKRCSGPCGELLTIYAFTKDRLGLHGRRGVCRRCEITARTNAKPKKTLTDNMLEKIQRAERSHAKRMGLSLDAFRARHPWELEWLARDAVIIYEHGYCPRCHTLKFSAVDLHNFTLDVIFPELPPYQANLRWTDRTCNTEKGNRSAIAEAHEPADQQRWEQAPRQRQLHLF